MTDQPAPGALRLTLKLHEDQYPALLVELRRTRKGQRRAARLAMLATIGLLTERHAVALTSVVSSNTAATVPSPPPASRENPEGLSDEDLASLFGQDDKK